MLARRPRHLVRAVGALGRGPDLAPGGEPLVVRGGGHLFILERPAGIAELVTSFLAGEPVGATVRAGATRWTDRPVGETPVRR